VGSAVWNAALIGAGTALVARWSQVTAALSSPALWATVAIGMTMVALPAARQRSRTTALGR
jgi:hypothetical protein